MSGTAGPGDGEASVEQRGGRAHARVDVSFDLRGGERPQVAAAAAELIDRLQELASRSKCECDLDVCMGWHAGGSTRPQAAQEPAREPARRR